MNARQLLLQLNRDCGGNWDAMYRAIKDRRRVEDEEIAFDHSFATVVDAEYPEKFKTASKPPFIIFYEGDIKLLDSDNIYMIIGGSRTPYDITNAVAKLSKSHVIASYYDNDFDKEILRACMRNRQKFIILTSKSLDDLDRSDDVIDYAAKNGCLILTEYGFESGSGDYASVMRYRLIVPFLQGVLLASSVGHDPKVSMLVEAVAERSGNVYALPESPFKDSFNNRLIRDGAMLVDSLDDVATCCQ